MKKKPLPKLAARAPRTPDLAIYILLAVCLLAVFAQVRHFDFVNYDDPDYVTANAHVQGGLTLSGLGWALTSFDYANWFPLTWISHMADVQMFGLNAGGHHFTSVLLHLLSTLLLFAALRRLTRQPWPSAFVALVFGLHPLHVESVAWVTERKDVLSAFFWMLTLWAYARYVESPRPARYALVAGSFACGLMAKPMLVTLPFVLLLLDIWPLRRLDAASFAGWKERLVEKLPLFALTAVSSVVTFLAQQRGGAVIPVDTIPQATRFGNALISYLVYLIQMFWPVNLAVFYPFPAEISIWHVGAAIAVLAAISGFVLRGAKERPYLLVGWLWYLGTLVPVIGFVQVGLQAHADRYAYLPLVGIAIILAWGAADVVRARPSFEPAIVAAAVAACLACAVLTGIQTSRWANSELLFRHALAVTSDNYTAHDGLGLAFRDQGRIEEAIGEFERAIRIRPQFSGAQNNLAEALLAVGRPQDALPHIEEALQLNPESVEAHNNRGAVFLRQGNAEAAVREYREAVRLDPLNSVAHRGLGGGLSDQGLRSAAVEEMREAIRLSPRDADAYYALGLLFAGMGRTAEAVAQFTEAVRLKPADVDSHYNLGTALGAESRYNEAIEQFQIALRLKPDFAGAHLNLGKALAEGGRAEESIAHFEEAVRLNPNLPDARESLALARTLVGASKAVTPAKP
ncbi:MAG: tetratricopeptide repeat protein [Bryobacteraceae bacterium]